MDVACASGRLRAGEAAVRGVSMNFYCSRWVVLELAKTDWDAPFVS